MNYNLGELLVKHFNGQTSEEEERALNEWLDRSPDNRAFYDSFSNKENIREKLETYNRINTTDGWQKIEDAIGPLTQENSTGGVHFLKTRRFLRYAAAILIILTSAILLYRKPDGNKTATPHTAEVIKELPPGGNKAMLTLADGSVIELGSAANGQLAKQGKVEIVKLSNGQLSYVVPGNSTQQPSAVTFNTLKTPKGGQYQIILPDGTKVWLNAASSITYPTLFSEKERVVEITGEAYFEVRKNAKIPFKVKTPDNAVIEVLGTHFNVNAYADEAAVKVSLLEGSVRIGATMLKPGQSFRNGSVANANVEQDIAWKNGVFNFHHLKLPEVMRQIARWYDVDVHYDEKAADIEFGGKMGRNLSLQQVLRGLEGIDENLHFKLEGRTLFVIL